MDNTDIKTGVEDMTHLSPYLEAYSIADKASFDMSLARGLDYYTGLIYEVITTLPSQSGAPKSKSKEVNVGSIAAGGGYDSLVGMYGDRQIPCVGISFGVERIFTILEARQPRKQGGLEPGPEMDVYIAAAGKKDNGLLAERMWVLGQLTKTGIRDTFKRKANSKLV